MPADSQIQPTILAPPRGRSPLKWFFFILLILVFLNLALGGVYYFRLKGKSKAIPTPTPGITSQGISGQNEEVIDVLALPGWLRPESEVGQVTTRSEGGLLIQSEPGTWMFILDNRQSYFKVIGEFDVQFTMKTAGRQSPEQGQEGQVNFYSDNPDKDPNWLQVGLDERNRVLVAFLDNQKKEATSLIKGIIAPSSGNLRVRFENVRSGLEETVIVYNGETGEELGRAKLPLPLFSQDLYLGLRLINTLNDPKGAVMTVSHFKILISKGSGNIIKI